MATKTITNWRVHRANELRRAPMAQPGWYTPPTMHYPAPAQRRPRVGVLWGFTYLVGMVAAALSGSIVVIVGLATDIDAWSRAVMLAGVVPTASIFWVVTLLLLGRLRQHYMG